MAFGRAVRRLPGGELRLRLGAEEREVLRSLPGQLRELLAASPDDPSVRRLAPPAYADDDDHEAEYRRLMGDDLAERRLAALAVLEETAGQERLSEEQAQGWLAALNSLRLVLGTQLDVGEDLDDVAVPPDDPRAPGLALYGYLSWLLAELVDALAAGLPEAADEEG
ncbi:MAG TPA: DUF2017 family protein [Acidimicrobiales bacterium]|nr:DUF2017 family protein [Acidimicrobiales bacterium]